MRCEDVREELVHFHYGEVEPLVLERIEEHLGVCDHCARERDALVSTLSLTHGAKAPPLPEAVRERLWARVEAKQAGLFEALWAIFVPMVLGGGTCLVSLYPLHHFRVLHGMDPSVVILGAVAWASVFNSVFTSILHQARLRRLLAPPAEVAGGAGRVEVDEPESARGVRIQVVIYGLLVAFTGLFWAALVLIGPGSTRTLHVNTAQAMTGLSVLVLSLVGFGIGLLEKHHAFTTSTLVSAIFCALGVPALLMISHGQIAPAQLLQGTACLLVSAWVSTGLGRRLEISLHSAALRAPAAEEVRSRR